MTIIFKGNEQKPPMEKQRPKEMGTYVFIISKLVVGHEHSWLMTLNYVFEDDRTFKNCWAKTQKIPFPYHSSQLSLYCLVLASHWLTHKNTHGICLSNQIPGACNPHCRCSLCKIIFHIPIKIRISDNFFLNILYGREDKILLIIW